MWGLLWVHEVAVVQEGEAHLQNLQTKYNNNDEYVMCIYIYVYTYIHIISYVCVYIYIYMYTCIICIYTYIHTCIERYSYMSASVVQHSLRRGAVPVESA